MSGPFIRAGDTVELRAGWDGASSSVGRPAKGSRDKAVVLYVLSDTIPKPVELRLANGRIVRVTRSKIHRVVEWADDPEPEPEPDLPVPDWAALQDKALPTNPNGA